MLTHTISEVAAKMNVAKLIRYIGKDLCTTMLSYV